MINVQNKIIVYVLTSGILQVNNDSTCSIFLHRGKTIVCFAKVYLRDFFLNSKKLKLVAAEESLLTVLYITLIKLPGDTVCNPVCY